MPRFTITEAHLDALKTRVHTSTTANITSVTDAAYEDMMTKAFAIKPKKRAARFKAHVTDKSGVRTKVRFCEGFLFDSKYLVVPQSLLAALKCTAYTATGRLNTVLGSLVADGKMSPEAADHLMSRWLEARVERNATGNHYRNHTLRVRVPAFRTTVA